MKTRTIVWMFITVSGVIAFVLMQSADITPLLRLLCAYYALIVSILLFTVVGVTLSAKFKRLDTTEGLLARLFFLGWW